MEYIKKSKIERIYLVMYFKAVILLYRCFCLLGIKICYCLHWLFLWVSLYVHSVKLSNTLLIIRFIFRVDLLKCIYNCCHVTIFSSIMVDMEAFRPIDGLGHWCCKDGKGYGIGIIKLQHTSFSGGPMCFHVVTFDTR